MKRFALWFAFLLVITVSRPVQAQDQVRRFGPFKTMWPACEGITPPGAMIVVNLTVFHSDVGFPRMFNGEVRNFCNLFRYDVEAWVLPGLPSQTLAGLTIDNAGTAFSADRPTVGANPHGVALTPLVWGAPRFNPRVLGIRSSGPGGPTAEASFVFQIYSDSAPVEGNIRFFGIQQNDADTSCSLSVVGRFIVPAGPDECGSVLDEPPTEEPTPCVHRFNLAQAYSAIPATLPGFDLPQAGCWGPTLTPFTGATVPGVLCLTTAADNLLNVNAFVSPACCPTGTARTISSVTLTKVTAASAKCPSTFRAQTFIQSGRANIRTWWPLNYTAPGTSFTLEVRGTCNGRPLLDTWRWEVVANPETLRYLVEYLHTGAIGVTEIPCLADEATFAAIRDAVASLATAIAALRAAPLPKPTPLVSAATGAVEGLEAIVFAGAVFVDTVADIPESGPPPPGNLVPLAAIWDTLENPCGCKLIADAEYVARVNGLGA